ncbi:hypothetical protein BO94DRAFT_540795 [Aspergillus sclerotioniger CBS 115572]|uniref:IgE-binding protein n=1 Tax=Aspergillus sclerotioniger CBS 115572 TaxID=1450535 RepID=A0A317UVF7_9EURO|nr:hypothetical protein BO94DRAFT_540795 [Aspergillus sclerotioniger CBS 115572]PWY65615.1 hypothetical protein BO94DRAFT_540795 [Aspergillus sclerotioniger CBS 115572]
MALFITLLTLTTLLTPALTTNCSTSPFTVISTRSGTPIQNLPLTAASNNFYLDGTTSSYCLPQIAAYDACPPGNETVISGNNYLDSAYVQEIYIDPTGAVKFVEAHTTYMPSGASTATFCYTPGTEYGTWTYTGLGATGFMACPITTTEVADAGPYQVFAALGNASVPTGNVSDCLDFEALAVPWGGVQGSVAAWEYV